MSEWLLREPTAMGWYTTRSVASRLYAEATRKTPEKMSARSQLLSTRARASLRWMPRYLRRLVPGFDASGDCQGDSDGLMLVAFSGPDWHGVLSVELLVLGLDISSEIEGA